MSGDRTTHSEKSTIWRVIGASSAGTVIEWYDFYIFGSLAKVISVHFFPKEDETLGFLWTLGTFATGFIARPFGAVVFGRVGDLVGRKVAFLLTLLIMGFGTAAIGVIPSYESIGAAAPLGLLALRLLQGLALGGEYGGAAIYVAEHAPDRRRGFYTSFIQITATAGLFLSLGVILSIRGILSEASFNDWGWRLPFLLSIFLIGLSLYVRLKLRESPLFVKLKEEGKGSIAPIRESLGSGRNWKLMALALFGAAAGQGVIWYTGQFYALYFLQNTLKVNFVLSNQIVAAALVLGAPLFVLFGALSDRIGRKKIMLGGNLLALATYLPIYHAMSAHSDSPLVLTFLVFVQVVYVTMVYGPIAAFLVELFPARIRYTSLSLPYHLGNGIFGGLMPLIGTLIVEKTGDIYAGLYYPIGVSAVTLVVGSVFLRETHRVRIWDEVEAIAPTPMPAAPETLALSAEADRERRRIG
jgi:MFS family permease